ncbi:Stp1/IreP family PP2C-type Ser/Thr phosphatase [Priestia aryabhattai]|uniref:Stp1/IreP family PP2C-type Ser/Thr phosphatase n=1 Tax=Priestia aryabhattai TaxID=412384 RepID=UPI002E24458A|nr:Stp1/IreP family PP2C-type Ser/Thr phosphatase [Priestia aryabhattai]MED4004072.1 Stp1/IreP family PP2C-type Ser/Thr phosphatase [Priestia aryabhattai]
MATVFMTDRGRVRQHNEDNGGVFLNQHNQLLAIVADGMGGHRAGDIASEMAVQKLQIAWEEANKVTSPDEATQWIRTHVSQINQDIYRYAQEHEECKGMGTTVVLALCADTFCAIGNIGDSRCYISNEYGFQQVTEDHSLVNELVKNGQITKEDAEHHPRKNILLRALGTEENVSLDVKTIEVEKEDRLLLCSDGLTNKVTEQKLNETLSTSSSLHEKGTSLIRLANELGGEDNITLAIVDFTSESG